MSTLINLLLKLSGLTRMWDAVDGYKTKLGAGGLMLAGLGMMLTAMAGIVATYVACPDHTCQLDLLKQVTGSANGKLLIEGFIVFKSGLMGLGIAHKVEKAAADAPAA